MSIVLASVVTEDDTNTRDAFGVLASGRFISIIGGAEPEDDDTDENDGDEDEDDDSDENDDDPDSGKSEEELRAELKKLRGTVKNQRKSEREARKEAARLKANGGTSKTKKTRDTSKDDDDDEDVDTRVASARDEAAKERDTTWKKRYVQKAAVAALASAGFTGRNPARFAKANITTEDLEDLEVDDDGEVEGLDDLIRELKRENREQFVRRAPGSVSTGDDDEGTSKAKNGSKTTSVLHKLVSGTAAAKKSTAKSRNR